VNHEERRSHAELWQHRLQDSIDRSRRELHDRGVDAQAESELRAHLETCDQCRDEYASLSALHARLATQFAGMPGVGADFSARLFARIDADEDSRRAAAKQRAEREFRRRARAVELNWRELWQRHAGSLIAALAVISALIAALGATWQSLKGQALEVFAFLPWSGNVLALPLTIVAASASIAAISLWWLQTRPR